MAGACYILRPRERKSLLTAHTAGSFMVNFFYFIDWLIGAYIWVIIIQAILSWLVAFNVVNTQNRFIYAVGNALYQLTEPVVGRVRRFLPPAAGIDFSPLVVIIGLFFVRAVVLPAIARAVAGGV